MTAAGASEHLYLPHDDDDNDDDGSVGAADDSRARFRVVVRRDDVGVFNTHRMKVSGSVECSLFAKYPFMCMSFFLSFF